MSEPQTEIARQRKGRSPSYPGIDLELALQRTEELWAHEHHYKTAIPTILGHWGYGAKSGGGFAALAALKSFGLLEDEGTGPERRAWLSDLAQEIIHAGDPNESRGLIQEAATRPKIHYELWNKFGQKLPSDQSLELFLMRERDFTPSGASELVSEWKRTMAFAGLAEPGANVPPKSEDKPKDPGEEKLAPPPTIEQETRTRDQRPNEEERRSTRTVQLPYSRSEWALLQASFPLTEADWQRMLAVLEAMKPGLVHDPEPKLEPKL